MATILTPDEIKQKIQDWITSLGGHEITGAHLNAILSAIMDYVGVGFAFKDSAPAAAPSSDVPVVYIAGPGTYTGYENDAVEVPQGSMCIFKYDGSDWSKSVLKIHDPDVLGNQQNFLMDVLFGNRIAVSKATVNSEDTILNNDGTEYKSLPYTAGYGVTDFISTQGLSYLYLIDNAYQYTPIGRFAIVCFYDSEYNRIADRHTTEGEEYSGVLYVTAGAAYFKVILKDQNKPLLYSLLSQTDYWNVVESLKNKLDYFGICEKKTLSANSNTISYESNQLYQGIVKIKTSAFYGIGAQLLGIHIYTKETINGSWVDTNIGYMIANTNQSVLIDAWEHNIYVENPSFIKVELRSATTQTIDVAIIQEQNKLSLFSTSQHDFSTNVWLLNYGFGSSGASVGDTLVLTPDTGSVDGCKGALIPTQKGDIFFISAYGGSVIYPYVIVNKDFKILEKGEAYVDLDSHRVEISEDGFIVFGDYHNIAKIYKNNIQIVNLANYPNCIVKYSTTGNGKFEIYQRYKNTSIYFMLPLIHTIDNTEIEYSDFWRISDTGGVYQYDADNKSFTSLNLHLLRNPENEFAFKFTGKADFTGGFHGDERIDTTGSFAKFFIDGKEIAPSYLASNFTEECQTFYMLQRSTLHDTTIDGTTPITGHPIVAIHFKKTEFVNQGFVCKNRVDFDFSAISDTERLIDTWFCGLVCINKDCAKQAYADDFILRDTSLGNNELIHITDAFGGKVVFYAKDDDNLSCVVNSKTISENDNNCEIALWDREWGDTKYYRYAPVKTVHTGDVFMSEHSVVWSYAKNEIEN